MQSSQICLSIINHYNYGWDRDTFAIYKHYIDTAKCSGDIEKAEELIREALNYSPTEGVILIRQEWLKLNNHMYLQNIPFADRFNDDIIEVRNSIGTDNERTRILPGRIDTYYDLFITMNKNLPLTILEQLHSYYKSLLVDL